MNYLGHIFLSGENEQLLVGNFIGDYVKGKSYNDYPEEIKKGILLHRTIDDFTDNNANWIEVRNLLKPIYKRYAGVVADVLVDHFLAANWETFHPEKLGWYSKWVYAVFLRNFEIIPRQVQGFLPYLIQHRRLQSYAELEGFEMSIRIMSSRTSLPENTDSLLQLVKSEYSTLEDFSLKFLDDVIEFTNSIKYKKEEI